MRTKIKECNGNYALVQFFPDSDKEQSTLTAFKNNRANDSIELAVTGWVENAMLNEGLGQYSVVGFEGVQNNVYFYFKIQKTSSLGGY